MLRSGLVFLLVGLLSLGLGLNEVGAQETSSQNPVVYRLPGLNFSPYIDGQDPNQRPFIPPDQILERLLLVANDTHWIRTYGLNDGLEAAPALIDQIGRSAAVGAWIGTDPVENQLQIDRLIDLANQGYVDLAIVGSEVLLRGDLPVSTLVQHIQTVRAAIPAHIPVTTGDVYREYLQHPEIVDAVDVLLVNSYPYWEAVAIEEAIGRLHCWHAAVLSVAGGKRVMISESGWPSDGDPNGNAIPSPENAAAYFFEFVSWAHQHRVFFFYFSALDESWKAQYEGPHGAHWGIRDKDGVLKPGMERVFWGEANGRGWLGDPRPGGGGVPELELSFVPPIGSDLDLRGVVRHVHTPANGVAVYIRVHGEWWTKPRFSEPLSLIDCDGGWVCDITTGGQDAQADRVAAFLLPISYDVPLVGGEATLPQSLYDDALAVVEVDRQ